VRPLYRSMPGSRRDTGRNGTGSGFQAAMIRAHSRACAVSVTPGNSRRSSTAADNSPSCSKVVRIAAASASETTNMLAGWERTPTAASAGFRRPVCGSDAALRPACPPPPGCHFYLAPTFRRLSRVQTGLRLGGTAQVRGLFLPVTALRGTG
jgi:hypothetical protein